MDAGCLGCGSAHGYDHFDAVDAGSISGGRAIIGVRLGIFISYILVPQVV